MNDAPRSIALDPSSVSENKPGFAFGILTVTDPDPGDTHTFTVTDNRFEVFTFAGITTLRLKPGISLDHESEPSVGLSVTATDSGGAGLSFTQPFTVSVADVNEAPTAIRLTTNTVVADTGDVIVGTLIATDPDAGESHTFTITQADDRFEIVDGNKLKVKAGSGFSLSEASAVSVFVQATDSGAPGLSTTQRVAVIIRDSNAAPTNITLSAATVAENDSGANIGTLTVTDAALVGNHVFTFSDDRFTANGTTLKLKDGTSLDHEAAGTVTVTVTATDSGDTSRSLARDFDITVTNVNEAPTGITISNATVTPGVDAATVGQLTVVDPDSGDTFNLTASDARFEIVNGALKLRAGQSITDPAGTMINIDVTATDTANSALTFTQSLTLTVGAAANSAPTDIILSAATVNENAVAATIGNVTVADPDSGDTHTITVSDNRFEVVNGVLQLKSGTSLDHEAAATIPITLTANDSGNLEFQKQFTITVADVNEAPTGVTIAGSQVRQGVDGDTVGQLTVVDPDDGDTFNLTASDARFEVVNGVLKLRAGQSVTDAVGTMFSINVTATDTTNSALTFTQSLTLTVGADANRAPTDITLASTSVNENATGATVGAVTVVDPDSGDSHTITVSDNRFEIANGELRLKSTTTFDHETTESIPVTITAVDAGNLQFQKQFTITVNDVNEAPTAIALSNLTIIEGTDGAVVGTVTVTDPDDGQAHTLTVDDTRFEVAGGQLKLKAGQTLHSTTESTVTLVITAQDNGSPNLSLQQSFTITVASSSSNLAPSDIALSNVTVLESVSGAIIGNVTVTDPNAGDTHQITVDDARFEIVNGQLKLTDNSSLLFADAATIEIQLTATDDGTPQQSRQETFTLSVTQNATAWQNVSNPVDVNNDGFVSPLDALLVINMIIASNNPLLLARQELVGVKPASTDFGFVDVNGDGFATAIDVLQVINHLNNPGQAEGESRIGQDLLFAPASSNSIHSRSTPDDSETSLNEVTSDSDADAFFRSVGLADTSEQAMQAAALLATRALADESEELDDLLDSFADDVTEVFEGRD